MEHSFPGLFEMITVHNYVQSYKLLNEVRVNYIGANFNNEVDNVTWLQ